MMSALDLNQTSFKMDYGFVLEKNKNDFLSLSLPFMESDSVEFKQKKLDLIGAIGTS